MGTRTVIEWTDATWNPVTGCTKVSPGCKFCYAERITEQRWRHDFSKVVLHPERRFEPHRWRRPRRIFTCSMADLFHEDVPRAFLREVLSVIAHTPRHTYQVLTKRAERMQAFITEECRSPSFHRNRGTNLPPLPNLWLGVSAEDQIRANERIPLLLQTPAAVRFVSLEPLLGPINLQGICSSPACFNALLPGRYPHLDWVIVGGESGGPPKRALVVKNDFGWQPRQPHFDWVVSIRDQCIAAGVPFFFKQFGGPTPKSGGRVLDGRTWDEFPNATR